MGGSQGASGINELILSALPLLGSRTVAWQWLHLTGPGDVEKMEQAYAARGFKAVVKPFLAEMEWRSARPPSPSAGRAPRRWPKLPPMRLPALLVPYPAAADNHQFFNAQAFEATGAARMLEQKHANPDKVAALLCELIEAPAARARMQTALAQWHAPKAAERIADSMLAAIARYPAEVAGGAAPAFLFRLRWRCGSGRKTPDIHGRMTLSNPISRQPMYREPRSPVNLPDSFPSRR